MSAAELERVDAGALRSIHSTFNALCFLLNIRTTAKDKTFQPPPPSNTNLTAGTPDKECT
jgi:hypothetical protein